VSRQADYLLKLTGDDFRYLFNYPSRLQQLKLDCEVESRLQDYLYSNAILSSFLMDPVMVEMYIVPYSNTGGDNWSKNMDLAKN